MARAVLIERFLDPALLLQRRAKIVVGLRPFGLTPDGRPMVIDRVFEATVRGQEVTQAVMRGGIIGIGEDRRLEAHPGLVVAAQRVQRGPKVGVGLGECGLDAERFFVVPHRLVEALGATAQVAEVDPCRRQVRILIERAAVERLGLGHAILSQHEVAEHGQRVGVLGPELQDALVQAGRVAEPPLGGEQRAQVEYGARVPRILRQRLLVKKRGFPRRAQPGDDRARPRRNRRCQP